MKWPPEQENPYVKGRAQWCRQALRGRGEKKEKGGDSSAQKISFLGGKRGRSFFHMRGGGVGGELKGPWPKGKEPSSPGTLKGGGMVGELDWPDQKEKEKRH